MVKLRQMLLILSALASWCALSAASTCLAVEEAYGAVVNQLHPGQQNSLLGEESLVALFNTLENRVQCEKVPCGKCNLLNAVHQLVHNHSDHRQAGVEEVLSVDASEFTALAAGCVLYLSSPDTVCAAADQGRWGQEVEHFLHGITSGNSHEHHHEEEEEEDHYAGEGESCDGHEHPHVGLRGLESVLSAFLKHYESSDIENCITSSDIMLEVEETQVAGAVLGRVLYHALRGRCFQTLPEESFFLDYIVHLGSENFTITDLEALMASLDIGPELESDHGHGEHEHHDHGKQLRLSEMNGTWEEHCFSAHELVQIHNLTVDSPNLGRSDLARLSPALIQQILSGACAGLHPAKPDELSKTERYLYATLANVIITLMSMFGIVLLLCTLCTSVFQLCIQFCISLAVGSLTGDALLHLLPMFLGLHVHTEEVGGSHHHSELSDYVYKMLVVLGGIYYFYLMETIFNIVTHGHHHHGDESEPHHCDHGRVLEMYQEKTKNKYKMNSTSKTDLVKEEEEEKYYHMSKERTREHRLLPYMITLGDGIHNFADGLAMGAAFSLSWKSGLATTLAVLCHELPHELGDFAILLNCGLSVRKALLLNIGSALTSFVGLYIALSVATDVATMQWIAAVTTGLFLYVGLADMLPTMMHIKSKRPWLIFALQNVGLLCGWAILLLLSVYEESISF